MSPPDAKDVVREKYGQAALRVKSGEGSRCCCGDDPAGSCDPITSNLYDAMQEGEVPDTAIKASLGCAKVETRLDASESTSSVEPQRAHRAS